MIYSELDGKEILEIINNNEYTKDMQVDTGYPIFLYSMGYNILKQLGDLAHFGLFKIIIIITIFNTKKQRNYMIIK